VFANPFGPVGPISLQATTEKVVAIGQDEATDFATINTLRDFGPKSGKHDKGYCIRLFAALKSAAQVILKKRRISRHSYKHSTHLVEAPEASLAKMIRSTDGPTQGSLERTAGFCARASYAIFVELRRQKASSLITDIKSDQLMEV
jgi:hypothetical protein